jgi:hypothetical protein
MCEWTAMYRIAHPSTSLRNDLQILEKAEMYSSAFGIQGIYGCTVQEAGFKIPQKYFIIHGDFPEILKCLLRMCQKTLAIVS